MKPLLPLVWLCVTTASCVHWGNGSDAPDPTPAPASKNQVVRLADVEWGPLNPARGDKGPKAGTLWGDRTDRGPSGFLVEFVDGFESPPHIHNVSYRGAVLYGLVHNDDPEAGAMWMPGGSFWTQPKGGVHITAAKGRRNLAYIEIEDGPYLVQPVEEAFDSGEVPINVDASNLVWIDPPNGPARAAGAQVAYLWGSVREGGLNGTFIRLPAGFRGSLRTRGAPLRAVVIQGHPRTLADTDELSLEPGSYFGSDESSEHRISCGAEEGCVVYVRAEGPVEVVAAGSRGD